uniref:Immunoglobulin domain-containing protein n=1 Tax=Amphilophus citrinellus TaxID=61819 RepID=A0A3Q0S7X4_AMPCI
MVRYILLILAATLTDGLKLIKVEGFQGRNVSFQCPHKLAWAYDKYLCKDPCTSREDRLVTVKSGGRAESGRITLVDSGDGSFTVTFSHLQLSDSQNYWCAVDRPGFDTYTEIQLTVLTKFGSTAPPGQETGGCGCLFKMGNQRV